MAEQLDLTTPITLPTQTFWKLRTFAIDLVTKEITIILAGTNGERQVAIYTTPPPPNSSQPSGQTLLTNLNTANLSTKSLVKRVLERLQTDGYLGAGSVTGTPD